MLRDAFQPVTLRDAAAGGFTAPAAPGKALLEIMQALHSSRAAFDPHRPVPADHLGLILEAARWAPTAHNMQNSETVVVVDPERLGQIAAVRSEVSLSSSARTSSSSRSLRTSCPQEDGHPGANLPIGPSQRRWPVTVPLSAAAAW